MRSQRSYEVREGKDGRFTIYTAGLGHYAGGTVTLGGLWAARKNAIMFDTRAEADAIVLQLRARLAESI